jgi:hypothetical protein
VFKINIIGQVQPSFYKRSVEVCHSSSYECFLTADIMQLEPQPTLLLFPIMCSPAARSKNMSSLSACYKKYHHSHGNVKMGKYSCLVTCHGGALGERRYSSYSFLTSALDGGEWSASHPGCTLHPGKEPMVTVG